MVSNVRLSYHIDRPSSDADLASYHQPGSIVRRRGRRGRWVAHAAASGSLPATTVVVKILNRGRLPSPATALQPHPSFMEQVALCRDVGSQVLSIPRMWLWDIVLVVGLIIYLVGMFGAVWYVCANWGALGDLEAICIYGLLYLNEIWPPALKPSGKTWTVP